MDCTTCRTLSRAIQRVASHDPEKARVIRVTLRNHQQSGECCEHPAGKLPATRPYVLRLEESFLSDN